MERERVLACSELRGNLRVSKQEAINSGGKGRQELGVMRKDKVFCVASAPQGQTGREFILARQAYNTCMCHLLE